MGLRRQFLSCFVPIRVEMKRDECGYEQRRFRRDKRERIFIFYRNGPVPHIPKPARAKEVQDMYQEHYYDGIEGRALFMSWMQRETKSSPSLMSELFNIEMGTTRQMELDINKYIHNLESVGIFNQFTCKDTQTPKNLPKVCPQYCECRIGDVKEELPLYPEPQSATKPAAEAQLGLGVHTGVGPVRHQSQTPVAAQPRHQHNRLQLTGPVAAPPAPPGPPDMTLVPTGKYERMEAELLQLCAQNAAPQEKLDGSIHVMGEGGFLQTGILPGKSRDCLALAMDKAATNGVATLQNKTRFKNWVHVPQGTKSDDEISRYFTLARSGTHVNPTGPYMGLFFWGRNLVRYA